MKKKSYIEYVPVQSGVPVMKPYGHQIEALNKFRESDAIALFFEMGCGKTFTTLAIAEDKFRRGLIEGLVVVAPNDVHKQWYNDLVNGVMINGVLHRQLGVNVAAQCIGGRGGKSELASFNDDGYFHFVSVNVDTFSQPTKWKGIVDMVNNGRFMIAIDEATCLKNPSSNRAKRLLYEFNDTISRRGTVVWSAKKENTKYRAILTGTPVTNGTEDLWALMEFVQPNYFGRNFYSFKDYFGMFVQITVDKNTDKERRVSVPMTEKTWEGIHACYNYIQAFNIFGVTEDTYLTVKHQAHYMGAHKHADELTLQLSKASMFKKLVECVDMPERSYIKRDLILSDAQKKAYKEMTEELFTLYKGTICRAKSVLTAMIRLQQISSGFIVNTIEEQEEDTEDDTVVEKDLMPNEVQWLGESNPKLDALMRDVRDSDKPLLILTKYSAEAQRIYELCEKAGYRTGLFTGWKVVGGVEAFKAGELDVLVANTSKIARGFNLQISHTILFFSNSFSMEERQQAEFRTFRTGQKEKCVYVDYIAAPIDRVVLDTLQRKKDLLDEIRDGKIVEELVF